MPSANPDLTVIGLPSPKPADPPDVPGDIAELAKKVTQTYPFVVHIKGTTAANGKGTIAFSQLLPAGVTFIEPPGVVAGFRANAPWTGYGVFVAVGNITTSQAEVFTAAVDGAGNADYRAAPYTAVIAGKVAGTPQPNPGP